MSNHGLRTTGTHTGNFGHAKVKGKPGELDLTKEILSKDNLRIPPRDEGFTRLIQAYNKTEDPRLKATLWDMLKKRKATLNLVKVKPNERPRAEFWEMVRNVR